MKTYRDTMTDQDKLDLADYLASLDAERDFLRENPYTPIFGQYAPSLGHYEPDLLFTDEEDTAGQPDDHYYQAAGQEPPTEADRQLYPIWGYCFAFILLAGSVAFLWAFFGYVLPWFIRVYVEIAGIS